MVDDSSNGSVGRLLSSAPFFPFPLLPPHLIHPPIHLSIPSSSHRASRTPVARSTCTTRSSATATLRALPKERTPRSNAPRERASATVASSSDEK